ncbi:MAG: hypothetical protein ABJP02_09155 [Parasphingorhabdus sp.]|uniref:hypothetical protein n=1 Tax=Parasphingorhabdus sp. TaxID=2709688 RepID=UPI0032995043
MKSDSDVAKKAALSGQKAVIKASAATADTSQAVAVAAKEIWEKETGNIKPEE